MRAKALGVTADQEQWFCNNNSVTDGTDSVSEKLLLMYLHMKVLLLQLKQLIMQLKRYLQNVLNLVHSKTV